ncbi:hypothetical protein ABPG74_010698 [Tetrahymena malaccensis]
MEQTNEYQHNEFMMPENALQFTPLPFHSPHQGIFTQLNLPPLEDKLNLEYSALLNPENKDQVITKIDQYNEAGKTFINVHQYHNALKIYELIVEAQPKNEKAAVLYAKCLQLNEEYHRAIFFFRYAMEINDKLKNDAYLWYNIGLCFFKIESYTQAEQNFKHCLKVDYYFPQKFQIYLYLGIINKYNLQYKIAIEYFLMNLSDPQNQNPDKASLVLINIGQCLECFQEYDEAASCYNKSLCLTPGNFTALKAISWLFFQNGKIIESKDILMQALYINSDREIYYMQARCLEQLGKHKEAMQAISQAIQAEPNNPDNFTVLGVIFSKLNMHLEAFQSFQRAYQMDTAKIENLFNMALIYEVAKKYQDALKLYTKLLLLDPQDCIVLQRKACIESQNYQNLTEYQFQMRFPAFKPSAQLWWVENQKFAKFNVLHEISGISLYQNNQGQTSEKIEHGVGSHSIFETATKKASLLSQGNIKNENDDLKSSASFTKSANNLNNHKNSITTSFNNQFNNQFIRSRNSSFNCKQDESINENSANGQNGVNKSGSSNNKNSDIPNSILGGANIKNTSMDLTGQRRQQIHRNKLYSMEQGYDGNDGHNTIYEKKEEEQYSFSNSPKKDDKNRKESDLYYEQTRRNSIMSNFAGQQLYSFVYSPFNGPAMPKDSIDFGYSLNNNNHYYGDQMDNGNPNDLGGNRQKKSSIIGHNIHNYNNINKNINNKNDNQIYQ